MTDTPPKPPKPKPCPKAQPRGEKRQHILELLTVRQPRTNEELSYCTGIPLNVLSSVLILMEQACLIRRIDRRVAQGRTRGKRKPPERGANRWALRCWKGGEA